ncbi:MAG: type II toxin-antitoxin system RelE/ParE family toxin [Nanoarchaeota archaeon]
MNFEIFYDKQPQKFLEKLDKNISARVKNKIEAVLAENPVPHNAVAIEGEHGIFRLRVGDYRALYRINYQTGKIVIIKIDKRSRVYD